MRTTRLCASLVLFRLSEEASQQFVLRSQQKLNRAEPLHHVLQYVVQFNVFLEVSAGPETLACPTFPGSVLGRLFVNCR
jgi:hypothetical protein